MPLSAGTRIGPYEIVAPLGEGGMGEVYRATDTHLGRAAAIKVLPETFALDAERIARFEREARTLASLNHPHIAQVFGLEKGTSGLALAMELVEGPTLADLIDRGPIPLDDVLPIARQIAEALEAAHDQGIIHRDLKPANIKVRDDGAVKVLDFGLAKAMESGVGNRESGVERAPVTAASITTPAMTAAGVIMGTAAYMSPEQARGRPVDRRADIWAFGCVLYEMLTGRRAFQGDDVSETLAFVLTKDPDWSRVASAVPNRLQRLLRGMLEKDARRRVSDAAVVRWELEESQLATTPSEVPPASSKPGHGWHRAVPWMAAAVAGIAAAGFALRTPPVSATEPGLRVRLDLGAPVSLQPIANTGGQLRGLSSSVVVSPDGRSLVFVTRAADGTTQLYRRRLDQLVATPLVGTEDAGAPFFSPDGQWIGFFADRKLKKVPTSGGSPVILCDAPGARGGTWTAGGTIVFAPTNAAGLVQVSDGGGTPQPLTTLADGEVTHRWPQALPNNRGVLFTGSGNVAGSFDTAQLLVVPLSGGPPTTVLENATFARYVESGHLVYVNGGTLYAVPFDLERLAVSGGAVPIVERVSYESNTGVAQVDVGRSGALVYVDASSDQAGAEMTWLDREGRARPLRKEKSAWNNPRFAPDGRRIALDIGLATSRDVWVYDTERDVATRLTFAGTDNAAAIWSPDGQYVAYRSNRGTRSVRTVYAQRADGSGEAVALTAGTISSTPTSWHPSGRHLAVSQTTPGQFSDVMVLAVERSASGVLSPGAIEPLVAGPALEGGAKFSPDGRWLAYVSNESGRNEIYVRPFPASSGKWQVSNAGGGSVEWSSARQELVYADLAGAKMVVPYRTDGGAFVPGAPKPWPGSTPSPSALGRGWALHPDGVRLVVDQPSADQPLIDRVTLITRLSDELRALSRVRP